MDEIVAHLEALASASESQLPTPPTPNHSRNPPEPPQAAFPSNSQATNQDLLNVSVNNTPQKSALDTSTQHSALEPTSSVAETTFNSTFTSTSTAPQNTIIINACLPSKAEQLKMSADKL